MPAPAARILGFDLSLRATGFGCIAVAGSRLTAEAWGVVRAPASWPHSRCLANLQEVATRLLGEGAVPEAVAIEGIFHARNVRTAITLGEVRGVVLAVCAAAGIPVFEYAPREVKQAVVGWGAASKEQVAKMVGSVLGLAEPPTTDAADALGVAICHAHQRTGLGRSPRRTL